MAGLTRDDATLRNGGGERTADRILDKNEVARSSERTLALAGRIVPVDELARALRINRQRKRSLRPPPIFLVERRVKRGDRPADRGRGLGIVLKRSQMHRQAASTQEGRCPGANEQQQGQ
jgi:hypothetical protein